MGQKASKNKNKNALNTWQLWGIPLFSGHKRQVLSRLRGRLKTKQKLFWIATVNPEFVMAAEKDKKFKQILTKKTDLNVMDGIGLVWAREIEKGFKIYDLGFMKRLYIGARVGVEILRRKYRKEVVAGCELMQDLIAMAAKEGWRVFLLGGWQDRAARAAQNFQFSNTNLQIESCEGRPKFSDEETIDKINKSRPDLLFVAYGMKSQEEWIEKYRDRLKAKVVMGVGRSLDYFSGDLRRAPLGWRKVGLEWLYSLIVEPKRWRRQLALPKFAWRVIFG